ncbi:glycine--tRNA ligase beta subunit [Marinicauda pacifica]|uniref:Glycine--tRNA ligase beta subunit n=1 Tax=Marinicauda pacifica TaxID=1133559 RepID=A0A4S2HDN0_9PROT|nr:glycine--tRNA ligase subunit beta [Marinicauda pacifica]TGY94150.1 glycine--tRNA ligase subunit beta [Marinicauda pacifica]GGE33289.1 glycine--tRNA ligase beta subunit [Marinicauda pacifica]
MSELLLEFFSEEIPARMQARAEADLVRLMTEKLSAAGLSPDSLEGFAGPRRLGLVASGLPAQTADVREERKGPRVGAPDKAIEGFLRGAGLESLDQCKVEESKKGSFYVAIIEKPGRKTTEVIAEAVPEIVKSFPWPKSMKFGEGDKAQRWVRPLHRITAVFDGKVVPFAVFGIESGNTTEGHRIHSKGDRVFTVDSFADYAAKLADNGVVLKRADRERQVLDGAKRVCADAQLELVEDEGLLAEVAGLVEHPVPVLGEMDPAFLDLPPEVITLTMKVHQKYFAVRDPKTGKLAPKFVMIANQDAPDGGKAIAAGAARVLSARLSDARHFWDLDRKRGLEAMASELSKVTFHEKLGTVADKVERVAALARELATVVGADADMAEKAARLCKADLVSQMVYEFPELQGAMGRYYALEAGLDEQIADAIKDHYKPQGPSDAVPTAPVSAAVALADKLDTLVGFWAIDEKPTGSKDPFALRRAALGVVRIVLSLDISFHVSQAFLRAGEVLDEQLNGALSRGNQLFPGNISIELELFFADRLKVHLKDEGVRFDVIDAVFALGDDDLVRVTKKARALQDFLETGDGTALLAGYRRAANILKAEEKKGFDLTAARAEALSEISAAVDASEKAHAPETGEQDEAAILVAVAKTSQATEEKALIAAIEGAETVAQAALAKEDFEGAMRALAGLRAPVDSFFDAVVVNVDNDDKLRRNRLLLLSRIRASVERVADFGKLEG